MKIKYDKGTCHSYVYITCMYENNLLWTFSAEKWRWSSSVRPVRRHLSLSGYSKGNCFRFPDSLQGLSESCWFSIHAAIAKYPRKWKSVPVCKEWKTSSRSLTHERWRSPAKDIQCLGQHYSTGRDSQWLLSARCSFIIMHICSMATIWYQVYTEGLSLQMINTNQKGGHL